MIEQQKCKEIIEKLVQNFRPVVLIQRMQDYMIMWPSTDFQLKSGYITTEKGNEYEKGKTTDM